MMIDEQLICASLNKYHPAKYVVENGFIFLAAKSIRGIDEARQRSDAIALITQNRLVGSP